MPNEARIASLHALVDSAPEARAESFARARAGAGDTEREVRAAACEAIAATADPSDAIALLGRLAADADVGVRHAAVTAIAGLPWRGRLDLLARALDDEDSGVVAVAADGLSWAGDARASSVLCELMGQKQLQFGALEGLYALKDSRLDAIARPLFSGFLTPLFEKTIAALALARGGDVEALQHVRRRVRKRFAAERGFLLMHLIEADRDEGRVIVEAAALAPADDQRESALLALTRLDAPRWWPDTESALREAAVSDPPGAAEVLFGLAEIDWRRAAPLAQELSGRADALGSAARKITLGSALREAFPEEILIRCA